MDANRKAYRDKLNAKKQEKRINSPLVRYNENDQPVCRVCNVVLKSESNWRAHEVSSRHREAVKNLKAQAAAQVNNVKQNSSAELTKLKDKSEEAVLAHDDKHETSTVLQKTRQASQLPSDFFDNHDSKRQKEGTEQMESAETRSNHMQPPRENANTKLSASENRQVKGALPEGFFDNKDADLRARGITPVKLDIKDEYKEFEKLIQEDLQQVDNRLEEEEYDAADTIEVAESVEQRTYRERVETLKRKKMELKAAKSAMHSRSSQLVTKDSSDQDSSSDDDSDDAVDWRAKHL
ncbi:Zinc finger protein 830 [Heracleum sosnowskyi]|uniref:Zinc finger protein 830 n=1 Tax=Heracleum sosnowskyi TaxID=360622 RepID=A0AAD8H625_9APIA|nr:Zinc finger protein 830 [Heracleum sosnowskyi]